MRVLYAFSSPFQEVYDHALSGTGPDVGLYGLNHMRELGIQCEFKDDGWERSILSPVFNAVHVLMSRSTGLGFNLSQAARRLVDVRNYDLVFATTDSVGLPFALLRMLGLMRVPLVVASQGLTALARERGMNWAFRVHRHLLRYADRIVYYGFGEGAELQKLFGVPPHRLVWTAIGADTHYFHPVDVPAEDVILSVGRDHFRDYGLLMALAKRMPTHRFRIITSPHCLAGLSIPENVATIFDVPFSIVRKHYARSRLIVLPLRDNGYSMAGLTLLQCLSMARPVILSHVAAIGSGGEGYRIRDGVECRLVPPGDVDALEEAVRDLWGHPEKATALGRAGRQTVECEYTTRRLAERLAMVFWDVLGVQDAGRRNGRKLPSDVTRGAIVDDI